MRNRAKCKLCHSIVECLNDCDLFSCSCGEITVDIIHDAYHASVKTSIANFVCIDDEGNEIIPKRSTLDIGKSSDPVVLNEVENGINVLEQANKASTSELMAVLDAMIERIDSLPPHARTAPVTHSDFGALLSLIKEILRCV